MEATEQIKVLNKQLEVQKVAVTEKSEACDILLKDILEKKGLGEEKREMAQVCVHCMQEIKCYHRVAPTQFTIAVWLLNVLEYTWAPY